ncbi:MAG: glycosyltransferase [Nitrososphaerota archaeon]
MTFFSVVIATLGIEKRPSIRDTLRCLANQTFRDFEVITWQGEANEYQARNKAVERARGEVIAFCDDDTTPPKDWLEKAVRYFEDPSVMVLTGPISGDFWGWGRWMRISKPFWGVGCNLFIRRSAFREVGGFDWNWGLHPPPRGWRSDTDILARIIMRFGFDSYVHAEDVEMVHPGPMGSSWVPDVEKRFYLRHKWYALRYIAPYDPRLCQSVLHWSLEDDPRVVRYLGHDQKPRLDWIRSEIHGLDYRLRGKTRILDVGGEDGFLFARTGWEYTVMDIDLYEVPDGKFVRHDADNPWPFEDESFDVVVLGDVLEHVERPEHVWKEACRVARYMVLATIPNEYEWDPSAAPLITREERMRRDGFTDVDAMARAFASKSPFLRELTSEKVKPHLWHVRWFRRGDVENLVGDAEIGEVRAGKYVWFTVKWQKRGPQEGVVDAKAV